MRNILTLIFIIIVPVLGVAQIDQVQSFEVKISSDSILFGNYLEVRFTAKNIQGEFEPPKFEDFDVIGGPNQSTSMSIVNGKTSQTASYSYFIKPRNTGLIHLEPAYFVNGEDQSFETSPVDIYCLPNPDGEVQESRIDDDSDRINFHSFPFFSEKPAKPKKKLKVTKI